MCESDSRKRDEKRRIHAAPSRIGRDKGSYILVKENDDHDAVNILAFDLDQAERSQYVSKSGCTLLRLSSSDANPGPNADCCCLGAYVVERDLRARARTR